jgi:hypothetical protein
MSTEESVALVRDIIDDCIESPNVMPIAKSSTHPPSSISLRNAFINEIGPNKPLNSSKYSQSLQSLTTRHVKHSMGKKSKHGEQTTEQQLKAQNKNKSSEHLYYKFNDFACVTRSYKFNDFACVTAARSTNFLTQSDNYAEQKVTKPSSLNNDTIDSCKSEASNTSGREVKSSRSDTTVRSRKSSTDAYHLSMIFNNAYFDRCLDMPSNESEAALTTNNDIKCSSSKSSILSSESRGENDPEEEDASDVGSSGQAQNIANEFGLNFDATKKGGSARSDRNSLTLSHSSSSSSSKSRKSASLRSRSGGVASEGKKGGSSTADSSDINLNSTIDSSVHEETNSKSDNNNEDMAAVALSLKSGISNNDDSTVEKFRKSSSSSSYASSADEIVKAPSMNRKQQQPKQQPITSNSSDSDVSGFSLFFLPRSKKILFFVEEK